jgi:hypothetical protein
MKSRNSLSIMLGLLAVVLFVSVSAVADENNSNAGTRVFNFLKIPVGARPMAMAGTFTGIADDETSLYYNPAGIALLEGKRFLAGYHNNIFDMQSGVLGYMHPLGEGRKVAVYINYLNYGEFIRTNSDGFEEGTFSGSDILFAGSYAMAINDQFSVGGTVKFIYEKVDTYSSTGFAVDLGGKLSVNEGRTNFGLMIQNLGAQLSTFVDGGDKDPLPLYFRAGASTYPRGLPLLVALDLIVPTDNSLYFALGGELLNLRPLYLRAGWTNFGSNFKTGASGDDLAGFSVGFGIEHRNMQISYTISPQAELGTSHRVTFTGGF